MNWYMRWIIQEAKFQRMIDDQRGQAQATESGSNDGPVAVLFLLSTMGLIAFFWLTVLFGLAKALWGGAIALFG